MKCFFAVLMSMMLMAISILPAQGEQGFFDFFSLDEAVIETGLATKTNESVRYGAALEQLKNHISRNEPVDLQALEKEFDELGFYEMSFMLSFYCKTLQAIDNGNYERAYSLLDIMEDDADFAAFRLANPWIGTLENVYDYVQGRQAEELWLYDEAVVCYSKCPDYRDSQMRKEELLDISYQMALDYFHDDTAEGYQQAEELFSGLGDYRESQAYAQKAQLLGAIAKEESTHTVTASAKGFAGPVTVTVTLNNNGKITALQIGSDKFVESENYGAKALNPDFAAQFVGLYPPLALEHIDAISGATVTSEAVVNAINKAFEKITEDDGAGVNTNAVATADETSSAALAESASAIGAVFSASSKGYGGPVQVTASFDLWGRITSLSIGGDKFAESPGFGDKVLEPAFAEQFIGKQAPVTINDIDAISGATITTEAVINAINKAYDKFMGQ